MLTYIRLMYELVEMTVLSLPEVMPIMAKIMTESIAMSFASKE